MKSLILFILLCASIPLHAATTRIQTDNIDLEVARIKKEIGQIQKSASTREAKTQKQRALIEAEMKRAREQITELETAQKKESANPTKTSAAARDRRKAAIDNLNKFLGILHSMSAQL